MCRDRPPVLRWVVVLLFGALTLAALTGCGRLDKDSVSTELKTIGSATGEGYLVAREAARSRASADFIEIRTAELSKQAKDASETLTETPTESGFQQAADEGSHIADRAEEILGALHSDPGNANLATNVERELKSLHDQAGDVEESL